MPAHRVIESGEGFAVGHGDFVLDRRGEQSGRRQHAGMTGHDHSRDAEVGRQRARMQRPGAAHRHQREFARVEPLAHRDQSDAFRHLGIDHTMDARAPMRLLTCPFRRLATRLFRMRHGRDGSGRRRRANLPGSRIPHDEASVTSAPCRPRRSRRTGIRAATGTEPKASRIVHHAMLPPPARWLYVDHAP